MDGAEQGIYNHSRGLLKVHALSTWQSKTMYVLCLHLSCMVSECEVSFSKSNHMHYV